MQQCIDAIRLVKLAYKTVLNVAFSQKKHQQLFFYPLNSQTIKIDQLNPKPLQKA